MNEKTAKARQDHKQKQAAASVILALGKQPRELTVAQLKVLLGALKRPDDGAMPTRKKDMLEKLEEWGRRGGLTEDEEVAIVETVFAAEVRTDVSGMDDNEGGEIEGGEYVKLQARTYCTQQFTYARWKCTALSKNSKSAGYDWIDQLDEYSWWRRLFLV